MKQSKDFALLVEGFFTEYLLKERGASQHTIRSYRDTFVLLLEYLFSVKRLPPEKVRMDIMNKDLVLSFLDWLEVERHVTVRTRNQRYAVLRSFFKYLMYEDPVHLNQWKLASSMKEKRGPSKTLSYLTPDGISLIFKQVDTSTRLGRRDLALLSTLYNTGARVSELVALTPSSIRQSKPYIIELYGKGSKKRIVPVDEDVIALLNKYMEENNLSGRGHENAPLFPNPWGERLTTPGISYIVHKYAVPARTVAPDLIPERISPHVFRHSRAMHLLQAGVNIVYIRDILGHVSIQTTEVYARADSRHKREALEKAYEEIGVTEPEMKSWEKDKKLKSFLKSLA